MKSVFGRGRTDQKSTEKAFDFRFTTLAFVQAVAHHNQCSYALLLALPHQLHEARWASEGHGQSQHCGKPPHNLLMVRV